MPLPPVLRGNFPLPRNFPQNNFCEMKITPNAFCRRCVFDRCFKNHRHSAGAVPDGFPATFAQDLSSKRLKGSSNL